MPIGGRTAFLACIIAVAGMMPQLSHAAGESMLRVYMDHARVLKLDRPVSKVIVGNSQVADATVADPKTIVLTGRSFGTTNIILLDTDGNAIVDEQILVSIDEGNTVRVFRQTDRAVLSCTPNCEQHAQQNNTTTTPTAAAGQ
ncbi:putative type II/III system pilus formation protein [Rhizobium sp. ERR 1071]|uniref:pilus assembly protein N-terminal domain-containing protein n=1 Tax=Rhizobium sp. ERR 1071 TaxID=2572677 RepID=UPI000DDDA1A8|nr:pilus assembly protein N-terminal domain-containing protein [Rhizobium sp. ERR1071]TWB16485.1 putative type II/III system pilus formation protein [Rhizobium sp. ERR1071]